MTAPETVVRYYNFDIVFAEIPGETTLAINIANCPNRCPGCHSPHLQADAGHVLDAPELRALLERYGRSVTCVCFHGRGRRAAPRSPALADVVRQEFPVAARRPGRSARQQPAGGAARRSRSTTSSWAGGSSRWGR